MVYGSKATVSISDVILPNDDQILFRRIFYPIRISKKCSKNNIRIRDRSRNNKNEPILSVSKHTSDPNAKKTKIVG